MAELGPLVGGITSSNPSLDIFRQAEIALGNLQNQSQRLLQSSSGSQPATISFPKPAASTNFDPNAFSLDISQQGFLLNSLIKTDVSLGQGQILASFEQAKNAQASRNISIQAPKIEAPSINNAPTSIEIPNIKQPGIDALTTNTINTQTPGLTLPAIINLSSSSPSPQVESLDAPSPSVTYDASGNTTPL